MPKRQYDRLIDSAFAQVRRSSALPGTASSTVNVGLTTLQVQEQIDASLVSHRAEADPHTIYLTQDEGDALYSALGHIHDDRYYTESESDARFVRLATAGTITARHTFAPSSAASPFILGANAQGQTVVGLRADQLNKTISVSGLGLSGGGILTSDRTIALASSANPGAAAAILASDAGGGLILQSFAVAPDTDAAVTLGRSKLFSVSTDAATLAHIDHATATNYGWRQVASGTTVHNAASGQSISYRIGNNEIMLLTGGGLDISVGNLTLTSGQDFVVGTNLLFADGSQGNVGINCAPDPQFDLDVAGSFRAQALS